MIQGGALAAAAFEEAEPAPAAPTPLAAEPLVAAGASVAADVPAAADVATTAVPAAEAALAPIAAPLATPAPVAAPAAQPVAPAPAFVLPVDSLQAVAESAGLQWVNSDADKIRAVQAAMANEPAPRHVPRERKPVPVIDEGPLVLVETRKDLSQVKLPFETQTGSPTQP
jgi:ribonuclease E